MGLKLGDAFVVRNFGARVTKELELQLGIMWTLANQIAGDEFQGFKLAIIQHTGCGFEGLGDAKLQQVLSENSGLEKAELAALSNADHGESIRQGIDRLRNS